jgi:hypothetical protein
VPASQVVQAVHEPVSGSAEPAGQAVHAADPSAAA